MPQPLGPRPGHVAAVRLEDLAASLAAQEPGARLLWPAGAMRASGVEVGGVTHDSRQVRAGDLYAALPGQRVHGAQFVTQAAQSGAVAVLTDGEGEQAAHRVGLPALVHSDPRSILGATSALVYGDPAKSLLMIGITGTNGKTTTCYLLDAVLRRAGHRTGLVGTVEIRVGDQRIPSVRTTPEAPDLHAIFAVMREQGVTACTMEVSSHALALGRVDGVVFDIAVFTNLSQDHLDFHGDLDHYFAAKASLFTPRRARRGVAIVDDRWGATLARTSPLSVLTVMTRRADNEEPRPDWCVERIEPDATTGGSRFWLLGPSGERLRATVPLPGAFNVANAAAAAVAAAAAGVSLEEVADGLARAGGVPGRMERVEAPDRDGPMVFVDYAHTPEAVAVALAALRPLRAGRLVVVLGAGGDRDRSKRAAMGAEAARASDVVVVTDDNPRGEDPALIRAAILDGARAGRSSAKLLEIADRAEAIRQAVRGSGAEDVVLVAGKGHEQGQEVLGQVTPFDDRIVAREALLQRRAVGRSAGRVGEGRLGSTTQVSPLAGTGADPATDPSR